MSLNIAFFPCSNTIKKPETYPSSTFLDGSSDLVEDRTAVVQGIKKNNKITHWENVVYGFASVKNHSCLRDSSKNETVRVTC